MTSRTNRNSEGENQQVGTRLSPAALQRRRQEAMKRYLAGDPIEAICREMGWLQSVDGSLRPPLFQIGACPFPCTPLLSILMLVTQTWREIVPLLPRFRILAVSMERLRICKARITMDAIDMVHLNPVVMLEE
jgi:hypothetical protein